MKKLFMLFLGLFLVLGIAACGGETTLPSGLVTTEVVTTETVTEDLEEGIVPQLLIPNGLRVNDETLILEWNLVEDASGYMIYVDGEFEAEVTGTSYDFSELTGDSFTFSVKAVASAGMADSNMSATIAYVANRSDVITAMELAISNSESNYNGISPSNPTAFATELVNKGMTPNGYETMMSNMADLDSLETLTDINDVFELIDGILDDMDMVEVEALISSIIKTELLPMLEAELEEMENASGMYYLTEDIVMYETMIEFLEENADQAVRSVMVVIEYIIDVESAIDSQMISNFETLVETNDIDSFDSSVFVTLKNDLVQMFKENLPSLEDVTLLNSTLRAFFEVYVGDDIDLSFISVTKQSASELISIELFFNFLLAIDEDYVDAFIDFGDTQDDELAKVFIKENIDLLDEFIDDNASLIEDMNAVFSDEEMETMFNDYLIQSVIESMLMNEELSDLEKSSLETSLTVLIDEYFDFNNILILQNTLKDNFNDLLDAIIESDYAIVDSFFDVAKLSNESDFLVYSDDYVDLNFMIMTEIVEPGTYYVKVAGLDEYTSGDYGITIKYNGVVLLATDGYLEAGHEYYYTFTITEENIGGYIEAYSSASFDSVGYLLTEEMFYGSNGSDVSDVEVVEQLILDILNLIGPIVEDTTYEAYDALLDLVISTLQIEYRSMTLVSGSNNSQDIIDILDIVENALNNTSEEQLDIFKGFVALLSGTTYFEEFMDFSNEFDSENGEQAEYGSMILAANAILDFYDDYSDELDLVIDELITALSEPNAMAIFNLTLTDVQGLSTAIDQYLSDLIGAADDISLYDYTSLTENQIEDLMTFVDLINRNVVADTFE